MQGKDITAHRQTGIKLPAPLVANGANLTLADIADHLPVAGGGDIEGEGRLEIGLVEQREYTVGVVGLQIAVGVDALIAGVDKIVEPGAVAAVRVAVAHR